MLYYTLLYAHLAYDILLWIGSYTTYLKEIEIFQQKNCKTHNQQHMEFTHKPVVQPTQYAKTTRHVSLLFSQLHVFTVK